jgi:uncharacterized damage-inducible protein DinB
MLMTEVKRIEDQLRRAFDGEAWHGPSLDELLRDVTAERAAERPLAGAHSIWEIALHIGAWERAALRRLEGDRAELSDEENWPPVLDTSEEAWRNTLDQLESGNRELRSAISSLDDSRLGAPIVAGMSSVYGTLHGVIQHMLYHAGQIALLKKG